MVASVRWMILPPKCDIRDSERRIRDLDHVQVHSGPQLLLAGARPRAIAWLVVAKPLTKKQNRSYNIETINNERR
jgi:hypothetical protein